MKKMVSLVLLVLLFEVFNMTVIYSQVEESIQVTVREFSPKEAKDLLKNWEERDKMASEPTVDVSGTWCFIKKSVSSENEERIPKKITMVLKQDMDGKVIGYLKNFFFADNQWKTSEEFRLEGKVSENILTGNLLNKEGKVLSKSIFSFKGDTFEGGMTINTTEPLDIVEVVAVRCSPQ